ncbi:MAG TPA: biotin/lipoyl-binding protein [Planctomycetota bacterium]|nr:biotin/lipoyl-binding protein [Planctomycetota bacterium]
MEQFQPAKGAMMEYEVNVNGQTFRVKFTERDGQLFVTSPRGTFPVKAETPLRSKVQRVQLNGGAATFGYHRDKERTVLILDGTHYEVQVREEEHVRFTQLARRPGAQGKLDVKAPMPGQVVSVLVKPGDSVKKNQTLLFLHAMKLENDIRSPRDGVVLEVPIKQGDALEKGALMVRLGPTPEGR